MSSRANQINIRLTNEELDILTKESERQNIKSVELIRQLIKNIQDYKNDIENSRNDIENSRNDINDISQNIVEILQEQVKNLNKQLDTKDIQLEAKDRQIISLIDKLNQEQQLTARALQQADNKVLDVSYQDSSYQPEDQDQIHDDEVDQTTTTPHNSKDKLTPDRREFKPKKKRWLFKLFSRKH